MARGAFSSMRDLRAKHGQELGQPGRMRGPGRRGHQIAVGMGLIDGDLGIGAARQPHLGRAGRIGRAGASLQDAGGRSSCAPWHTAAIGFSPGRRPARYPVPCRSGAGIPARGRRESPALRRTRARRGRSRSSARNCGRASRLRPASAKSCSFSSPGDGAGRRFQRRFFCLRPIVALLAPARVVSRYHASNAPIPARRSRAWRPAG